MDGRGPVLNAMSKRMIDGALAVSGALGAGVPE
jgi:hypothetical protein